MEDFYDKIREEFNIGEVDIRTYSPLTLAFIGDCVFDLVIRSLVVGAGNMQVNKLHKKKADIVKAPAQANLAEAILDELSEEELTIYRRGCNAHTANKAKNASFADYHKATGLEALIGYLYLEHEQDRILKLVRSGLTKTGVM